MGENQLEEHSAVTRFREYLRIETVHPNPDYDGAVKFLHQQAIDIDLDYQCIEVASDRPVVIMTWKGSDPNLSTIMLNSHIDVVPVYPDQWNSPPFAAEKRDNGDIVARGSQDMKCVGMQYLEAIRQLKKTGFKPQRTIHVTFVPDEEVAGHLGMKLFLKREEFKKMNVGFSLDEGIANPSKVFTVFYAERVTCMFEVVCKGNVGHGSRFIEDTSGEKMRRVIDTLMDFREAQKQKLKSNTSLKLGDVTSINLTIVNGGETQNMIPNEISATFDLRVTPSDYVNKITNTIEQLVKEAAGSDCKVEWIHDQIFPPPTSTDPSNPWWNAFSTTCKELEMEINTEIFSAGTDGKYVRSIGIPVLGFSPMNETPVLLHDHDEYLNENIYLKGIDIYTKIIQALSNVPNIETVN